VSRYGVLAIVWIFLGYFGVFDMGLSRAAANQIAKAKTDNDLQNIFWTALSINAILGLLGGAALYFVGSVVFAYVFKMPNAMHTSVLSAMPWIAFAAPVSIVSGLLTGTMEGRERFLSLNIIGTVVTLALQIVPLGVAYFYSKRLLWLIPAAVTVRALSLIVLAYFALKVVGSCYPKRPQLRWARILFGYGAWISVSNLISPLFSILDKIWIGGIIGATGVSYYLIPERLAGQASVFPAAITRTLFPQLSSGGESEARQTTNNLLNVVIGAMTPAVVVVMVFMRPFLDVWVGNSFAAIGAPIGVIIAMALWVNGLAYVPSTFLQARGRPDLTARFHLIAIIPYALFLWLFLHLFGLVGGAVAKVLSVIIDTGLLFYGSKIILVRNLQFMHGSMLVMLACAGSLWLVPFSLPWLLFSSVIIVASFYFSINSVTIFRKILCNTYGKVVQRLRSVAL
jgi:O-antigen/teichoic acid export membrane protein